MRPKQRAKVMEAAMHRLVAEMMLNKRQLDAQCVTDAIRLWTWSDYCRLYDLTNGSV